MAPMQDINLNLAIEDVNLILEGLGNLPFAKVYKLASKIQEQATRQLEAARSASEDGSAAAPTPPCGVDALSSD